MAVQLVDLQDQLLVVKLRIKYLIHAKRTTMERVLTLQDGNDWADHAALYDWGFAQPAGQETADHRREDTP